MSCLVVDGPYFRPCFFVSLFVFVFLEKVKTDGNFFKAIDFLLQVSVKHNGQKLYEKIVNHIKAKMWSYFGYCFHFSEVGLRESLLAAYLISLLPITD